MEEVARRGLPATIFVAPKFLGGAGFWWDELAGSAGPGLDDRLRAHALEALGGRHEAVMQWTGSNGHPPAPLQA